MALHREPYVTATYAATLTAPLWVDELANPAHVGQLSNADVNDLTSQQIETLIQDASKRMGNFTNVVVTPV